MNGPHCLEALLAVNKVETGTVRLGHGRKRQTLHRRSRSNRSGKRRCPSKWPVLATMDAIDLESPKCGVRFQCLASQAMHVAGCRPIGLVMELSAAHCQVLPGDANLLELRA